MSMLANKALVVGLVQWVAEVMAAWRTSCPRLTIWEDTVDAGLVALAHSDSRGSIVRVTSEGRDFLQAEGRMPQMHAAAE